MCQRMPLGPSEASTIAELEQRKDGLSQQAEALRAKVVLRPESSQYGSMQREVAQFLNSLGSIERIIALRSSIEVSPLASPHIDGRKSPLHRHISSFHMLSFVSISALAPPTALMQILLLELQPASKAPIIALAFLWDIAWLLRKLQVFIGNHYQGCNRMQNRDRSVIPQAESWVQSTSAWATILLAAFLLHMASISVLCVEPHASSVKAT